MKIRASRLPLAMVCPASMQAVEYDLNSDSEPARLGTAVHEWLATRIGNPSQLEALGDETFEQLAVKYTLSIDDIRALSLRAVRLWKEVAHWFPDPRLEVAMEKKLGAVELTGHVDVLSYDPSTKMVHVNDHKTGFLDADHADQVRGYGLMALDVYPEADRVHTCITKVRDYCTDHATYTRMELAGWAERVAHRLTTEGETYQPGRHCSFCPRKLTCQVFRDWITWAMSVMRGSEAIDLDSCSTPTAVREVYDSRLALKKLIDEVQEILRTLTLDAGGALDLDDGYQLQMISRIKTTIPFRESWPILSEVVPEESWNDCFKVGKTNLLELVKAGVGRGQKGKAAAELMERLEAAGATAEETENRLEHKKKPQEVIAS